MFVRFYNETVNDYIFINNFFLIFMVRYINSFIKTINNTKNYLHNVNLKCAHFNTFN